MSIQQHPDLDALAKDGHISDSDVLALRRAYFHDGTVDKHEALRIFQLGETCVGESEAWPRFLVEALTDYIVFQTEPQGYVSDAQAGWLIEHVTHDGRIDTHTELELLIKVLETAAEAPLSLETFALDTIKAAILDGKSRVVGDETLEPGVIGAAEVELLRRILFAAGGSSNIAISRHEAEYLFDLNDATDEVRNHPTWSDLFAKAILNHLMAANHYQAPSRERALRHAHWLDEPSQGIGAFLGRMFSNEMLTIKNLYKVLDDRDWQAERYEQMAAATFEAEAVTHHEAAWLAERIGRDGRLHENEKAILRFIRDECPELHSGLESLIAKL